MFRGPGADTCPMPKLPASVPALMGNGRRFGNGKARPSFVSETVGPQFRDFQGFCQQPLAFQGRSERLGLKLRGLHHQGNGPKVSGIRSRKCVRSKEYLGCVFVGNSHQKQKSERD